jgi:integrase
MSWDPRREQPPYSCSTSSGTSYSKSGMISPRSGSRGSGTCGAVTARRGRRPRRVGSASSARRSGSRQFLTQEELKRLFAAIQDKRDKALFPLAYRHGLRASETGPLQRTDVDLEQGRITIRRLKGPLSGIYPLQPNVVKHLRSYLRARTDAAPHLFISNRGVPIDRRTLGCAMQTYGEQAGLPPEKRKFHSLKHSIATHLIDARGELRLVQGWVGHKNVQNSIKYAQLTNPRRDEARKLFADHRVV